MVSRISILFLFSLIPLSAMEIPKASHALEIPNSGRNELRASHSPLQASALLLAQKKNYFSLFNGSRELILRRCSQLIQEAQQAFQNKNNHTELALKGVKKCLADAIMQAKLNFEYENETEFIRDYLKKHKSKIKQQIIEKKALHEHLPESAKEENEMNIIFLSIEKSSINLALGTNELTNWANVTLDQNCIK